VEERWLIHFVMRWTHLHTLFEYAPISLRDEDYPALHWMTRSDNAGAQQAIENIRKLIVLNNYYYQEPTLKMSLGVETCHQLSSQTDIQRQVDGRMHDEKRKHHRQVGK
jgi:hypothetical protein